MALFLNPLGLSLMHSKTTLPVLGLALCALLLLPGAQGAVWKTMVQGVQDENPGALTGCSLGGVGGMPPSPTIDETCVWGTIDSLTPGDAGSEDSPAPAGNETGGP